MTKQAYGARIPGKSPYYRMSPIMWQLLFDLDDGATLSRHGETLWIFYPTHTRKLPRRDVHKTAQALALRGLIELPH